ncbi:hypothetical protein AeMF1_011125 [Aphanomyces euteiches]|nr:hypothetical protein AeMF1_011125 [Aphanomyces euteiches]KAH9183446.1 hypothetical protein AeNC1_014579 [Aphanomyces euteiches]
MQLSALVLTVASILSTARGYGNDTEARWKEYLAFPNITSIETPLTTGSERYLNVRYNGEASIQTFTISADLTLDGLVLPESIVKFSLNRVQLASIPSGFKWPKSLETLDLSSNSLTAFPTGTALPQGLKSLSLSSNKLSTCISGLPSSLTDLDLSNNKLTSLVQFQWPSSLAKLSLSGNPLKTLSKGQKWPTKLVELHLDSTQLKTVPSTLPDCLEELTLDFNQIASFPTVLPKSLRSLSLSSNQITALPRALDKFSSLSVLQLEKNSISSIPENVALPQGFRMLFLSNNKLTKLPSSTEWLTKIESTLILDRNQLVSLPNGATFPPETSCAQNKITALVNISLPAHFNVDGNPLTKVAHVTIPRDCILQTGAVTLNELTVDQDSFDNLQTMMNGYSFMNLQWSVDKTSVSAACQAQNGHLKAVNDIQVCVVGGY